MFAPEHRPCRKESRRCPCNELGHTAKLNAPAALVVQNLRATSLRLTIRGTVNGQSLQPSCGVLCLTHMCASTPGSIFLPLIASAQTPEFQITKVTRNLIPTPQFAYAGAAR